MQIISFRLYYTQIIEFVNSGDSLRYIPDKMLSEEQKVTKWKAVSKTAKYTAEKKERQRLRRGTRSKSVILNAPIP